MTLKLWSQQYQHLFRTLEKQILSPIQDTLSQKFCGWGPAFQVLTSPQGDSDPQVCSNQSREPNFNPCSNEPGMVKNLDNDYQVSYV